MDKDFFQWQLSYSVCYGPDTSPDLFPCLLTSNYDNLSPYQIIVATKNFNVVANLLTHFAVGIQPDAEIENIVFVKSTESCD